MFTHGSPSPVDHTQPPSLCVTKVLPAVSYEGYPAGDSVIHPMAMSCVKHMSNIQNPYSYLMKNKYILSALFVK